MHWMWHQHTDENRRPATSGKAIDAMHTPEQTVLVRIKPHQSKKSQQEQLPNAAEKTTQANTPILLKSTYMQLHDTSVNPGVCS